MNARDSAWNAGRGVGTAGLALSLLVGQIGAHGRLAGRFTVITFYYSLAPNPMKVALCLEEMGLAYEPKPVDTRKGEQHQPDFLAINPNGKVPVIIDQDTGARVFDSNAILLFLAQKTGQFLPETTPQARGELLSWPMFVATGVGPFQGKRCISGTSRPSRTTTPSAATCTRPSATTGS